MSEVVKLPREVAEAIEQVREKGVYDNRNYEIMEFVVRTPDETDALYGAGIILNQFATNDNFDRLLSALVNGYDVEQTPVKRKKATFDFEAELHQRLKVYAARHGVDMVDIVETGIKSIIDRGVNA